MWNFKIPIVQYCTVKLKNDNHTKQNVFHATIKVYQK